MQEMWLILSVLQCFDKAKKYSSLHRFCGWNADKYIPKGIEAEGGLSPYGGVAVAGEHDYSCQPLKSRIRLEM